MLDVRIKGANDLRHMADLLRKADREDLGRNLAKAMKRAGEKTLHDVRDSAEHIHTTGIRKPGAKRPFVRAMPAKGTRKKIAESVELRVSVFAEDPRVQFRTGRGLPPQLAPMPRKFDTPGTFRHPVMGNRDNWVGQRGDPWFWEPIKDNLPTFRAEIEQALESTRQMLERG
jgi:hypothetical protein